MEIAFREAQSFANNRDSRFGSDENFRLFQNELMDDPRQGDVIPGTGGVRKVRVANRRKSIGKRGGLRVIYLYVEAAAFILLLAVYGKNEATDLAPDEKKIVAELATRFGEEIIKETRCHE